MSAYQWHYSERQNPDGTTAYLAECPNAPTQKFVAGPSKSRAALDSEVAECEKRWSAPANPYPNGHPAKASETLIDERRVVTGDGRVVRVFYRYVLPPKTDVEGMTFTDPNAPVVPVKRFGLFGSV